MPYCTKADLRIGDIRLPSRLGDGSAFVQEAADEIDAQLGHIYITPIVMEDVPKNRPQLLLLKKINWLLASGRIILDIAASSEDDNLHSYGKSMRDEALLLLTMIQDSKIVLTSAPTLDKDEDGEGDKEPTGPMILNVDSGSLIEPFYQQPSFAIDAEPYPVAGWGGPRPYDNQGR